MLKLGSILGKLNIIKLKAKTKNYFLMQFTV